MEWGFGSDSGRAEAGTATATAVDTPLSFKRISASGTGVSCALSKQDKLYCWGAFPVSIWRNLVANQLGDATVYESPVLMSDEEIEKTGRSRQVIPAGTYSGVEEDVVTTSLPVVAFSTTGMSDDTAYLVTKTFWEEKAKLADESRWWAAVTPELLAEGSVKLHPGALRYYDEAGVEVPDALR